MTILEMDRFALYFPAMNVELQPRVTGEATPTYNSVAWSVGLTHAWINPFQTLPEWDDFFTPFGYVRREHGRIAVYRNQDAYTHVAVEANSAGGFDWESKFGSTLRAHHARSEIDGHTYGHAVTYYNLESAQAPRAAAATPAALTAEFAALLHTSIRDVAPEVKREFSALFEAWKQTWFSDRLAWSSDTRDRTSTYSYRALQSLGTPILPLVVEKLVGPENFVALRLYEYLQPDAALLVSPGAGARSEQERAQATVRLFLASRMPQRKPKIAALRRGRGAAGKSASP